jgi:hypothetical protein
MQTIYIASVLMYGHQTSAKQVAHSDSCMCNVSSLEAFMERTKVHISQTEAYKQYTEFSIQASKILINDEGSLATLEAGKKYWTTK